MRSGGGDGSRRQPDRAPNPRPPAGSCPKANMCLGGLLREPNGVELVVQVVARGDLPAVHFAAVRNDPVPLERHDVVSFFVEETLLELPEQRLPFLGIDRAGLLVEEVVQYGV